MAYHFTKDGPVYDALLKLKADLGPDVNRRERMVVMIGACILNGFTTKHMILRGLRVARLNRAHVLGVLDEQTGTVPGLHLWRLDDAGHYHLLDPD